MGIFSREFLEGEKQDEKNLKGRIWDAVLQGKRRRDWGEERETKMGRREGREGGDGEEKPHGCSGDLHGGTGQELRLMPPSAPPWSPRSSLFQDPLQQRLPCLRWQEENNSCLLWWFKMMWAPADWANTLRLLHASVEHQFRP